MVITEHAEQVIVGKNGSGKSTILKLIARMYDPLEGTILVDGKDIKTFKLDDLRRATAVLFQDYTHFPLSVRLFMCPTLFIFPHPHPDWRQYWLGRS